MKKKICKSKENNFVIKYNKKNLILLLLNQKI